MTTYQIIMAISSSILAFILISHVRQVLSVKKLRKSLTDLHIVGFCSDDEIDKESSNHMIISGGSKNGYKDWEDYLSCRQEEHRKYLELWKEVVVNSEICVSGAQFQQKKIAPEFSDGKTLSFTMRGWGDLMAVLHLKPNTKYGYMENYC